MKIHTSSKLLIAIVASCTICFATTQANGQGTPAVQAAATVKKLGFRLSEWKSIHTRSSEQAQEELETLKKIGCEAVTENHDDHIDVRYRCPEWKSVKLASDQLVSQWAAWCEAKGMETVVMQPPANTERPTVQYRLTTPRTVHLHNKVEGDQIINTLNLVGCNVTTNNHGDHMDATFSCPEWLTIELPSEDVAHSWQTWLRESGFETQHTHVKE